MPPGVFCQPAHRGSCTSARQVVLRFVQIFRGMLVQDHDVGPQALDAPVFLREKQLTHERTGRRFR